METKQICKRSVCKELVPKTERSQFPLKSRKTCFYLLSFFWRKGAKKGIIWARGLRTLLAERINFSFKQREPKLSWDFCAFVFLQASCHESGQWSTISSCSNESGLGGTHCHDIVSWKNRKRQTQQVAAGTFSYWTATNPLTFIKDFLLLLVNGCRYFFAETTFLFFLFFPWLLVSCLLHYVIVRTKTFGRKMIHPRPCPSKNLS